MMGSGTLSDAPNTSTPADLFSRRARIRELWGLIGRIVRACKAAGVLAGIACEDDKSIEEWLGGGFRMFGLRSDARLLTDAEATLVRETSYLVGRTGT
jgi:2-keto-3-deoxy-L-rhamnonate aldolase RhmA